MSSVVLSSKISLQGSSPSGPRCRKDVKHQDRMATIDRAHQRLKERLPCRRRRVTLRMGDNSRVLRWPSRNGLHWRPVVASKVRESATAFALELVAKPELDSWASWHRASSAGRKQGSLPDDISLGTVFVIVLPNPLARDRAQASPKAITKRTISCSRRGVFTIIYLSQHADGPVPAY